MPTSVAISPLELAKSFGVQQYEIALKLDISNQRLRQLAKNPKHAHRLWVATLETLLEREKLALSLQSLLAPGGRI